MMKKGTEEVPKPSPPNLTMQALQDLIAKSALEMRESHNDNSSSNPDSPRDKAAFTKLRKNSENLQRTKSNQHSSSSSEKISPDLSMNHTFLTDTDNIRKPTKPTFLHTLSDAPKGSPSLKLRTGVMERGSRSDTHVTGIEKLLESSSGSEQDSIHVGRKLLGRRSLRKTKSRGKGKGPGSLEPSLVLDELEGEEVESFKGEIIEDVQEESRQGEALEHTVMVEIHHQND